MHNMTVYGGHLGQSRIQCLLLWRHLNARCQIGNLEPTSHHNRLAAILLHFAGSCLVFDLPVSLMPSWLDQAPRISQKILPSTCVASMVQLHSHWKGWVISPNGEAAEGNKMKWHRSESRCGVNNDIQIGDCATAYLVMYSPIHVKYTP